MKPFNLEEAKAGAKLVTRTLELIEGSKELRLEHEFAQAVW